MEYHELGERFEYNGVVLEVVQAEKHRNPCAFCFFFKPRAYCEKMFCYSAERKDMQDIYYKLVVDCKPNDMEQCKTKDMEQKTEIKTEGTDKTSAIQVTNTQSDEEIYGSLLDKLFTTYKAKDADYGSAFSEMFDELGIDYAYGKLREKMNRIKVLRKQPNMVENESLEDALLDTAGYAILTLVELKKRKR